ncbi:mechanosensitive ion channel family protein [Acuticoccus sp. MNP-M23]|uniref:mechanosensitive ion channel family protein n=1 Tax=Acuticoccus sp. MNP-M23 TaxID=3072793 RepID=UPI00281627BF|nr:mechanosensitive ion channel family protein [Acuticoccus sp. MNP-M23]WMS43607.1 mechanosensitive ion channel family protein [Acuticoccus sp. MNP-M23]
MEPITILVREMTRLGRNAIELLPEVAAAFAVILLTWLMAKLVHRAVQSATRRARLRQSLQELFTLLASILTWVVGLTTAAVVLFPTLTPASALAGVGLGSVAIGFAFKDVFENFFAGIMILFRASMRIGDFVDSNGHEGCVERITIRETYVRRTDGQLVILPNAMVFKNPLTVITDQEQRRTTFICGVAYGEDVDASRDVIAKAVKACSTVITEGRPVQIFAQEFASSSINFEVTWWTGSKPVDVRTSRDEVVAAVKRALDDAGIEIPFPYRTMTFKEPLRIAREDGADEG